MRTIEQWEQKALPKVLEKLTPRQRYDIKVYPLTDLPEFGKGWYIYGPVSSGKSTMVIQMYVDAMKRKYFEKLPGSFVFTTAYHFFEDIRRAQFVEDKWREEDDPPPRDEFAAMAEYTSAAILYFDDLGSTRFTDWQISQLQILVDQRYEMMLPTVYTSNLSLNELADVLGDERIPSRIKRTCKIMKVK